MNNRKSKYENMTINEMKSALCMKSAKLLSKNWSFRKVKMSDITAKVNHHVEINKINEISFFEKL